MPAYQSNPLLARPPILLVEGKPTYLFGGFNDGVGPMRAYVTNVALTTNVAIITVTINSGNIPNVGDLISIVGTASTSGLFNVTNAIITAVSITQSTGQGTIAFALTHANVPSAIDNGLAEALVSETSEALNNASSIPVTMSFNDPNTTGARTITVVVSNSANSLGGTPVWTLQGALVNKDSEYSDLNTPVAILTTAQVNQSQFRLNVDRFYRLHISGASGGPSGTVVAKVMV